MLGFNEEEKVEEAPLPPKEEAKPVKMSGVKKFKKLIKNPVCIGGMTYRDDEFSIDITALKKMNKRLTVQIERSIELGMIKAI